MKVCISDTGIIKAKYVFVCS